jgi:hypothetical protein
MDRIRRHTTNTDGIGELQQMQIKAEKDAMSLYNT